MSRPLTERTMSLSFVLETLKNAGLIGDGDAREAEVKEAVQRSRILKDRRFSKQAYQREADATVHPVDIVLSFNFNTPAQKPLTEDAIFKAIAAAAGVDYEKVDPLKLDPDLITRTVPKPFAQRHTMIPLRKSDLGITVATADPFDYIGLEHFGIAAGVPVLVVVASRSDIAKIITEFYGLRKSLKAAADNITPGSVDLGNLEQFVRLRPDQELEASDKHVVNAVDYLLRYAYDQRASDIHIEPKRDKSFVRFRIDGILHTVNTMPKVVHPAIVSRIKMLSRMDIAEKRRPQDGRIKTEFKNREIELRVSCIPVAFGEKIVIRIFDPDLVSQNLASLGFSPTELGLFQNWIARPHGIVLVTGPTGSGKSTTLYTALRTLASPEINIVTIEDPIENIYEDFNQIAVQPSVGITFDAMLRYVLRQDPDIIMIGEIRDHDTARHAVQAALTGHLVFSTLHTNDAPTSVTRLRDLGVEPFLIASTLVGVMAQRLVRKICASCDAVRDMTAEEITALKINPGGRTSIPIHYGAGCADCRGTGYRGRSGVFEMLAVDESMRQLILEGGDVESIRKQSLKAGMQTLRAASIRKLIDGATSFEEIVRVTTS
jgi:general secretion pathway protein E